ncbi:hypothetical protein LEN26_006863 [Aphanomyces euteiches]|nr:hypothetical protein AeMF1_013811 [Aphanomyces euteiches]KAH9134144.1 hypothetical protein LEN26_006863 [Aphanomyces euteiches]KAH9183517.1 hypothetical protein AeNC1_014509 [Aphanomyces euteiches]
MQLLDMNAIEHYFRQEDVAPYVVCHGIDVNVFNRYFCQDDCVVPLRCVELLQGRLLIVEYPSAVHETTVSSFKAEFIQSCGNDRQFAGRNSTRCRRHRNPSKEADASFGPKRTTSGRTDPPILNNGRSRMFDDWITLAVEVRRSQDWDSLERAAIWWLNYIGMEYVLLIKVTERARSMTYRLYDIQDYAHPNQLPPASAQGPFQYRRNGLPINITFDNRRLLSLQQAANLPPGVNPTTVINLRAVMREVIESINWFH